MNVLKKVRNLLILFAMALVIVGVAKSDKVFAATTDYDVNYEDEAISISTTTGSVYFTILKDATTLTDVSNAKFSEATPDGGFGDYLIDMSTISSAKTAYVGFVTSLDADGKTTILADNVITIEPAIKKLAVTLDYSTEYPNSLSEFLKTVSVTDADGTALVYTKNDDDLFYTSDNKEKLSIYDLQWRTATGYWDDGMNSVYAESYKVSGATLYMRYFDGDTRYSKEIKVKVSKVAKAPTVKITYKKDTVALKNGMQISGNGTDWTTIYAYDKASTNTTAIGVSGSVLTTKTSVKVSALTTNQIVDILNLTASGGEYTFYVRTAATDKKYPSAKTKVTFTAPAEAPDEITAAAISGSSLTITFTGDLTNYEYLIVKGSDIGLTATDPGAFDINYDATSKVLDNVKSKWTTLVTKSSILTIATTKYCPAYYTLDAASNEFKTTLISDATYVLLRAKGGTNDTADNVPSVIYAFPIE